jgi:ABC-type lipoprotein export system ATPase subunit
MYKIDTIKIDDFWHRFNVKGSFNDDVNIIIGKNGSGKTTFMNILYSVLTVDIEALYENDFSSVEIKLTHDGKTRTIKAEKYEDDDLPFIFVKYQISSKKYSVRCLSSEEGRMPSHYRRRAYEESLQVKSKLSELVSLASLSVYRINNDNNQVVRERERTTKKILTPVDLRLSELMVKLTEYELDLSTAAREVSSALQKEVLLSLLYKKEKKIKEDVSLDFDKSEERKRLVSAYSQLDIIDTGVRQRIAEHVDAIADMFNKINEAESDKFDTLDLSPLQSYAKTKNVIEMSLNAEKKAKDIYSQINLFLDIIKKFIDDKIFFIENGQLHAKNNHGELLPLTKLSSGEKQLLILLIEALLQNKEPYIFLADEPELSLHITWQREIIPAVKKLNNNAQIIVATHSPEVAGKYNNTSSIISMESMISNDS